MATIENDMRPGDFAVHLRSLEHEQLVGQELVQQGAIHAVSFLLANGCTKDVATDMLKSLLSSADAIRAEIERRGEAPLFESDQIAGDAEAPTC